MHLLTNKQSEAALMDGVSSAMPVMSWPVRAAGCYSSALRRPCHRKRTGEARGPYRPGGRRVPSQAETTGVTRAVGAGSAGGRWPNTALQRIAARWRMLLKPKGCGWAARAEGGR